MSVQPEDAPTDMSPGAPTATATPAPPEHVTAGHLLARIRADRRGASWAPAFERDWARALDDAAHSYSLAPAHDVIRTWRARLASVPAVEAFAAAGYDDSDGVDLTGAL